MAITSSDILEVLIKAGADLKIKNNNGKTAPEELLMFSAGVGGVGDEKSVRRALKLGANINIVFADKDNSTPLHEAVIVGNLAMVKFLLENKANPNAKDANGNTPAHKAAKIFKLDILEVLVKAGADLKIKNNNGETAAEKFLMLSLESGDEKSVRRALELGANVNTVFIDSGNSTSLHKAVIIGVPMVQFLLHNKAHVNAKNIDGDTPAHIAAQTGNKAMVDLLAKYGADLNIKNKEGKTVKDLLTAK
jgi:ankyrin repeat protein